MGASLTAGRLAVGFLVASLGSGLPIATTTPRVLAADLPANPPTVAQEQSVEPPPASPGPALLRGAADDPFAAVAVRVLTDGPCSGTALAHLPVVVTAAHCVLDDDGDVVQFATVGRGYHHYPVRAVVVDRAWADHPNERNDVALLLLWAPLPTGAVLASGFPTADLMAAGFQKDGLEGCQVASEQVQVTPAVTRVPCGLVPGASGGGLYAMDGNQVVLAGVLSTVTLDHTVNGFVPLSSVRSMMNGLTGDRYTLREVPTPHAGTTHSWR